MNQRRGWLVLAGAVVALAALCAIAVPRGLRQFAMHRLTSAPSRGVAMRTGEEVSLGYQLYSRGGHAALDLGGSRLVFLDRGFSGSSSGTLTTGPRRRASGSSGIGNRSFRDEVDGEVARFWFADREFVVRDGVLELAGHRLDLVAGGDVVVIPRDGEPTFSRLPEPAP